ncbi:hypothetical protein [Actinoplanes sp. RD1]|uniref:hypothetical protein n=1 Tax=Actinoplanes sp. RD1 TaxID=3064538 RepID=UPI00274239FE|nr:hypothetical protein [Actinoplanes sp. RD1]
MLARRIAAVLLAGAGVFGGAPAASAASVVAPASAPRQAAPGVRAVAAAAPVVRNAPAGFRLPPGSRVTDLADRASGASFTLVAPGPEAVLSFYRRDLPRAAFTIVGDRAADGATSLTFRDADGWAGAIFATPQRVTVAVRRS